MEALPLTMGLLTRSPIQINLQIKLAVDKWRRANRHRPLVSLGALRPPALSQIGAPLIILIWAGAAVWLFGQDQQGWGIFMIFWGLVVTVIDNFIKPLLIGVGVAMPMSLTILGVFGGFVAFGFLGLFIGPTLIAIGYTLLEAWRGAPRRDAGAPVR